MRLQLRVGLLVYMIIAQISPHPPSLLPILVGCASISSASRRAATSASALPIQRLRDRDRIAPSESTRMIAEDATSLSFSAITGIALGRGMLLEDIQDLKAIKPRHPEIEQYQARLEPGRQRQPLLTIGGYKSVEPAPRQAAPRAPGRPEDRRPLPARYCGCFAPGSPGRYPPAGARRLVWAEAGHAKPQRALRVLNGGDRDHRNAAVRSSERICSISVKPSISGS